jgi:pimeloyl-ACP methyl ester carboxylesterase
MQGGAVAAAFAATFPSMVEKTAMIAPTGLVTRRQIAWDIRISTSPLIRGLFPGLFRLQLYLRVSKKKIDPWVEVR